MTVSAPTKWSISDNSDKAVIEFVQRVLKLTEPVRREVDRRFDKRRPFPHLITLTPIDDQELEVVGMGQTTMGKELHFSSWTMTSILFC